MKKISIDVLKSGDVVARQVLVRDNVLLEKGAVVSQFHIDLLKKWEVASVYVDDDMPTPLPTPAEKKKRTVLTIKVPPVTASFSGDKGITRTIPSRDELRDFTLPELPDRSDERGKEVSTTPVYRPDSGQSHSAWAAELYESELATTELIFAGAYRNRVSDPAILEIIQKVLDGLKTCPEEKLTLTSTDSPENYLVAHSLNVCILSMSIGIELNLGHHELVSLGASGLLHDLGMSKVKDLVWREGRKLSPDEFFEIKKHTVLGADILSESYLFSGIPAHVAYQHHERVDASGYPKERGGKFMSLYSQIVACADVFEAVTSERCFRQRKSEHEAITIMEDMAGPMLPEKTIHTLLRLCETYRVISPQKKLLVMAIDDEPTVVNLVQKVLVHPRIDFIGCTSGENGLAHCRESMPDLLLLDLKMPRMTGYDFLRLFLQIPGSEDTRVVFLTSMASRSDVEAGVSIGIDGYIRKPFYTDQLRNSILTLLGIRSG